MAEGFANHYGSDVLIASSAGLSPMPGIPRETVEIMAEVNIDVSKHLPSVYEPLAASYFDIVVNMSGFKLPGKQPREVIEWQVEDPYRRPVEVYERVRQDIENRVMQLILKLRRPKKK